MLWDTTWDNQTPIPALREAELINPSGGFSVNTEHGVSYIIYSICSDLDKTFKGGRRVDPLKLTTVTPRYPYSCGGGGLLCQLPGALLSLSRRPSFWHRTGGVSPTARKSFSPTPQFPAVSHLIIPHWLYCDWPWGRKHLQWAWPEPSACLPANCGANGKEKPRCICLGSCPYSAAQRSKMDGDCTQITVVFKVWFPFLRSHIDLGFVSFIHI